MEEEISPVKEFLFDYLEKEKIQSHLSLKNSSEIIKKIISDCYSKVLQFDGDKDENTSILATGLLHYMLTNLLIPSQRKILINKFELDIVVPDIRTLSNKPQNALVIFIPKKLELKFIQNKLMEISKIQPNKGNIWIIVSKEINCEQKTIIISQESFANILNEINEFVSSKNIRQFKIFKN